MSELLLCKKFCIQTYVCMIIQARIIDPRCLTLAYLANDDRAVFEIIGVMKDNGTSHINIHVYKYK